LLYRDERTHIRTAKEKEDPDAGGEPGEQRAFGRTRPRSRAGVISQSPSGGKSEGVAQALNPGFRILDSKGLSHIWGLFDWQFNCP
jgi:hypothetical protein